MKWYLLAFCLAVFSDAISAPQAQPCAGLSGSALDGCQANQQKLQQQQLTQQQQQLNQLQQQLAQQQQQLAQQQEQLKQQQEQLAQQQQQIAKQQDRAHQDEILTQRLEHEKEANQPVQSPTTRGEVSSWKADNPWYGSDYARTQFAMRYAKQLQQERPDLAGRPFLDAISAKVKDTFGATR